MSLGPSNLKLRARAPGMRRTRAALQLADPSAIADPFAISFLVFVIYFILSLTWVHGRNTADEESGADDKRYQEARDELRLPVPLSSLSNQSLLSR